MFELVRITKGKKSFDLWVDFNKRAMFSPMTSIWVKVNDWELVRSLTITRALNNGFEVSITREEMCPYAV